MSKAVWKRVSATIAAIATIVALTAPTAAVALADPPAADITAVASLAKEASVTEVAPGETFTYTLTVGCSAITDLGCRGAVLSDVVPAPFVVVDAVVGAGVNTAGDPVISGNTVTVDWTTPLGDGTLGVLDATTAIVSISARLPVDASYDTNGIPVINDATIEGVNFADADANAEVTPVIPLGLQTTAAKAFTPTEAVATPGAPVSAALSGTNTSNATVSSLSIQDPVDPDAAPNPFDSLAFASFGAVTPPAGATSTSYEVYVGGAWVAATASGPPAGVTADQVKGTRVTFGGLIPAGASGSVTLGLTVTDAAATAPDGTVVSNDVRSAVALGAATATGDALAGFTLRRNAVSVAATKSFAPDLVIAGESTIVTIGGRSSSSIPIDTLTITEPSTGEFPDVYLFDGFTGPVDWPAGATAGAVVYTIFDGSTSTVPFAANTTPGLATGVVAADVVSFQLVFTGAIVPGGETSAPFRVQTAADLTGLPLTVPNVVGVEGENAGAIGSATATDDLYVYDERLEPYISKQIRPTPILAAPGQVTTVTLNGGLTERPTPPDVTTGTTGRAAQIVLQDPETPVDGAGWWNAFDVTGIAQTPVPGDSTLTVEYYDTTSDQWVAFAGPIVGPTIYSSVVPADVRADAGGVRFVYDYTGDDGGFAPGTDLAPSFTSTLRADGRYVPGAPFDTVADTVIPNCAQTDASSPTPGVPDGQAVLPADECPTITLIPPDPGNADLIDKSFGTSSSGGVKSVIARSSDTIPSTLRWSTGGYSALDRVELTDVASPESTPLAASIYNSFDLTRVQPITPATDPLIAYDAIRAVELYNGTAWVTAANNPCTPLCIGRFPGMNLTTAERASTQGVRLIVVESPARAAASAGDPTAPPVGSGVARSFTNDRPVTLTWQVRDTRRAEGTPVLGDELYNLGTEGVVRNTAAATGFPADGSTPLAATDQDDVILIDVPLTTTTDKNWANGPLATPTDPTIPANQFPLSRVTVTTRNTTPAKVDAMQITDTTPGSATTRRDDPFQAFTLNGFPRIVVPSGATDTQVTLSCFDGAPVVLTRTAALALTGATLPCEVSGVQVTYTGRIAANAAGVVEFDLRLRAYWRGTTERVSPADSPLGNSAQGVIADVDPLAPCPTATGTRGACDQDSATIEVQEPTFSVSAGKTISPAQQKENDFAPVTVTLSGQPAGSTRIVTMTLSDDDPSFWNAVDFVGVPDSWQLPAPLAKVQVCYLDGGTFTDQTVADDTVGGTQTCMDRGGDLSLAAAKEFLAAAPATLHGLSFQFWTAVELGWLNPVNPVVSVPFQVERRADLRTGEPTPTTRSDQVPAPGEQDAGIFVDTMTATGLSSEIAPGVRLADAQTAEAEYRNVHLQASVSVSKSPTGDVRPGVEIPFTLTFSNQGESALTNVVFSDQLPLAADGSPQLIFNPDRDPSVPPWSFALVGAAPNPPSGEPLPVDPDLVDVQNLGTSIVFTMPTDAVLEPGQSYTITLRMQLRPGLTPNDVITNTAAIDVTEPLDDCVPSYDPTTGLCSDSAAVRPLAVPALSTVKLVKADTPPGLPGVPDVRSDVNGYECDGTANADGFYRYPCVPLTLPGDTETWRVQITNAGTLPITRLVSVDTLPTPGDRGIIVPLPRGSQWEPTFADGLSLIVGPNTPPGAAITLFYSTSATPCTADLNPVGVGCAAGTWLPWTGSTDPDVLASVRSLKFQVDFPTAEKFDPGDSLTLQFRTRTTPSTAVAADQPTAYNTVATGGAALNGTVVQNVPTTEGRRVGVSYPTGDIALQKIVSGPASDFAPEVFPVQLACTIDGTPLTGLPIVPLQRGAAPTVVAGLPLGAECTAVESDFGQSDQVIGSATVALETADLGLIGVENVYDVADLEVTKTVASAAVDQAGEPIAYGPFPVEVSCTFLDQPAYADGYSAAVPMTRSLSDGDSWTLTGLPVNATCDVEETDAAGAASTTITVSADGGPGVVTPGASAAATVGAGGAALVTAAIENSFAAGAVSITKVIDGTGADAWGDADFEVQLTCTLDTAEPATVFDGTRTLNRADPTWTVENLASGASCEVAEIASGGANVSGVISPTGPIVVGDDNAAPNAVTVTNTFTVGSVTVSKALAGEPAASLAPATTGSYTVLLECTRVVNGATVAVSIPGGATRVITGASSVTYGGLPTGALCEVTESASDPVSQSVAIDPIDGFAVGEGDTAVQVTVTNTFENGSIAVRKVVTGDGAAFAPDTFGATVTCLWEGANVPLPDDGAIVLDGNGDPVTIDDIPTGSVCDVVERGDSGATTVTEPAPVTIAEGATAEVQIVNDYEVTGFTVTKAVDASGAVDQDGEPILYTTTFDFAATCLFLGDEVVPEGDRTFTLADGDEKIFAGLPVGADCTVTETDTGDAASTTVNGVAQTGAPALDFTLEPGPDAQVTAAFVNVFTVGAVQVTKNVTGAGADAWGNGRFTVQLVCTFGEAASDPVYSATHELSKLDDTWLVENLPTGSACVVSELDDAGATGEPTLLPEDGTVTVGVTGQEGGTQVVTVTNDFRVGGLNVFKELTGPGSPLFSDGPFVFSVSCTYEGDDVYTGELTVTGDGSGDPLTSDTVTGIPVDAECIVTETDDGGADEVPAPVTVTIPDEDEGVAGVVTAGFVNTFSAGGLTLTKNLEGAGAEADYATTAVFTVLVTCQIAGPDDTLLTLLSRSYPIAGGETIELTDAAGSPVRVPLGSRCFGEETVTGGATASVINADSYETGLVVTTGTGLQTLALVATNTFDVGSLELSKVVTGSNAAAHASQSFLFELSCAFDQGQSEPTILMDREVVSVEAGQTLPVDELPLGAYCWVAEPDSGGADRVQITHSTSALPAVVGSDDATIVVTNTFTAPLPATGVDGRTVAIVGGIAGILVLGGALVLFLSRRRRNN
ncbi:DUF5979 domain-containing protein [Microbacterium sp. P02]|uniref:DUF5979 domain-containing protein n=1 Tax=Microbacterium sp. P02 TaxID=3366260 RepID=UPI00366F5DA6